MVQEATSKFTLREIVNLAVRHLMAFVQSVLEITEVIKKNG